MSKEVNLPTTIKSLSKSYSSMRISKGSRIVVLAAPEPACIASAAVIARTAIENNRVFHVRFIDPSDSINAKVLDVGKNSVGVLVGINAPEDFSSESPLIPLNLHESDRTLAINTLAFLDSQLDINQESVTLAAVIALLESKQSNSSQSIIKMATDYNRLREQRGFKLPGRTHISTIDTLQFSIYPYLDGITGVNGRCEKILLEANIPNTKWQTPLTQLNSEEAQNLTANLLPLVSSKYIPTILGTDYELTEEKPNTPVRSLATIKAFAKTVWARREMGLLLGVLIGDRARILRRLIDSYDTHTRNTVMAIKTLMVSLNDAESKVRFRLRSIITPTEGTAPEVLPDVGRILFETIITDHEKFLVMNSGGTVEIVWSSGKYTTNQILSCLTSSGISAVSTSYCSARVSAVSSKKMNTLLETLDEID